MDQEYTSMNPPSSCLNSKSSCNVLISLTQGLYCCKTTLPKCQGLLTHLPITWKNKSSSETWVLVPTCLMLWWATTSFKALKFTTKLLNNQAYGIQLKTQSWKTNQTDHQWEASPKRNPNRLLSTKSAWTIWATSSAKSVFRTTFFPPTISLSNQTCSSWVRSSMWCTPWLKMKWNNSSTWSTVSKACWTFTWFTKLQFSNSCRSIRNRVTTSDKCYSKLREKMKTPL